MWKEFQEFISRGNVIDLAVGVIIGAAFSKIVSSLVEDIIMPIFGAIFGGLDFNNYFLPLSSAVTATSLAEAKKQGAVFAYGSFLLLSSIFSSSPVIIFLMVKMVNNVAPQGGCREASDARGAAGRCAAAHRNSGFARQAVGLFRAAAAVQRGSTTPHPEIDSDFRANAVVVPASIAERIDDEPD